MASIHMPRQDSAGQQTQTVDQLIRAAHKIFAERGVKVSPSKVSRVIRDNVRRRGVAETEIGIDAIASSFVVAALPSAAQALWYDIQTMNNRHIAAPTEDDPNRRVAVPIPDAYRALPTISHMRFGVEAKLHGPEDSAWCRRANLNEENEKAAEATNFDGSDSTNRTAK